MLHTKAKIFNLALNALLLSRRIVDADTETNNEAKVLQTNWEVAFQSTLEDLDLDSTSTSADLELIETNPTTLWSFAYKYPTRCAFFRRINSGIMTDGRNTRVPLRIAIHGGQKVIFTNCADAVGEFIDNDVPIGSLSANVGLCVALKLAMMSAPLITGKGAQRLIEAIEKKYVTAKAEAQEQDGRENFNFVDESIESEFVEARTT